MVLFYLFFKKKKEIGFSIPADDTFAGFSKPRIEKIIFTNIFCKTTNL